MASTTDTQNIPSPPEFTFNLADTRLKITYKDAPAYAHVYSGAMALASPVWKKFLFPPWGNQGTDSTPSAPIQDLDFSEDNSEALLILLCVAHLQFEDILARSPPKRILIGLAILCDQYMCQDLLRPWVQKWITRRWNRKGDPYFYDHHGWGKRGQIHNLHTMMLLGWVFRPDGPITEKHVFSIGVEWLVESSTQDSYPEFPDDWPMPAGLISMCLYVLLIYTWLTMKFRIDHGHPQKFDPRSAISPLQTFDGSWERAGGNLSRAPSTMQKRGLERIQESPHERASTSSQDLEGYLSSESRGRFF